MIKTPRNLAFALVTLSVFQFTSASATDSCHAVLNYGKAIFESKMAYYEQSLGLVVDAVRNRYAEGSSANKERVMQLIEFSQASIYERIDLKGVIPKSISTIVESTANFGELQLSAVFDPSPIGAGTLKYYSELPQLKFLLRLYGVSKAVVLSDKSLKIRGGYFSGWSAVKIRIEDTVSDYMKKDPPSTLSNDIIVYVGYQRDANGVQQRIATLNVYRVPHF